MSDTKLTKLRTEITRQCAIFHSEDGWCSLKATLHVEEDLAWRVDFSVVSPNGEAVYNQLSSAFREYQKQCL